MAAAQVRSLLENIINVSAATTCAITDQGLDDFDEFKYFTEENMKILCSSKCHLGSSISNPHAAVAGQVPAIRDSGHIVFMVAKKRIAIMEYAAMYQQHISCSMNSVTMTRAFISGLDDLRSQEQQYLPPPRHFISKKDCSI